VAVGKYVVDIPSSNPEQALERVEDYLSGQGFWKGKNVWKRSSKPLLSPEYITVSADEGHVHLEAWIKALTPLPGIWVKKADPMSDAPIGVPTKERLRPLLERIELMVR
jgi:hypothetical protein